MPHNGGWPKCRAMCLSTVRVVSWYPASGQQVTQACMSSPRSEQQENPVFLAGWQVPECCQGGLLPSTRRGQWRETVIHCSSRQTPRYSHTCRVIPTLLVGSHLLPVNYWSCPCPGKGNSFLRTQGTADFNSSVWIPLVITENAIFFNFLIPLLKSCSIWWLFLSSNPILTPEHLRFCVCRCSIFVWQSKICQ